MSESTRQQWAWSKAEGSVCTDCQHRVEDHACHFHHPRLGLAQTGKCSVDSCPCGGEQGRESTMVVTVVSTFTGR